MYLCQLELVLDALVVYLCVSFYLMSHIHHHHQTPHHHDTTIYKQVSVKKLNNLLDKLEALKGSQQ